jgi:hypothetical protein
MWRSWTKQNTRSGVAFMGRHCALKTQIYPMKKPSLLSFASFREQSCRRRLHAALRQLPVYEIENFACTDAANVLPVNSTGDMKVRHVKLKTFYRWLRFRIRRRLPLP